MAIKNGCCYPPFDWDSHTSSSLSIMESPFYSSTMSSGYLQDAIIEWIDRSKRRKMLIFPQDASAIDEEGENESLVSQEHVNSGEKRRRTKLAMSVAYPFAVVKPSGVEGDVTLKDINKRILKRPTRPIQHPVGAFSRVPCSYANGSGPSGNAIVALTKIQTQGRGTITIIRTKG